jgi:hypothetical protein
LFWVTRYKEPVYLFSTDTIPCSPSKSSSSGLEKSYRETTHPIFRKENITYQFNSHGYRCPEFSLRDQSHNAVNVVFFGCSVTFGMGLPEENTYPAVFTRLLQDYLGVPAINWNLGFNGASADSLSRNLISVISVLKPDIILLTFPPTAGRREYISDNGRFFPCQPRKLTNDFLLANIVDPELAAVYKANNKLFSQYNNALNLFKNYTVCESLCDRGKIMRLFAGCKYSLFDDMKHLICKEKLIDYSIYPLAEKYQENPAIGLAQDMKHPGVQPNQELAEAFFTRLQELYSPQLELLKDRIKARDYAG